MPRSVGFRLEIGPVPRRDRSGSAGRGRGGGRSPTACPGPRPAQPRYSVGAWKHEAQFEAPSRPSRVAPRAPPPRPSASPPSDPSPVAPALDSHGRGRAASPARPADRRRRRSAARAPSHPTRGTTKPHRRDPVRPARARSRARRPSVEQAHPLRAAPILGQPLRRDPGHDHTENRQCEPMSTRNSTDLGEGEPRGRSDPLQYPYHAMLMSHTSLLSNTHASDNPPTTSTSPSRTLRNMLKFA